MTDLNPRFVRGIERGVLRFVTEHGLLPNNSRVLLAVSGGADSLSLLHIIARNRARLGVEPLASYVDHALRPADEIAAERSFVEEQSRTLGIRFLTAAIAPSAPVGRRRSPEDAARRGRYAALASLARAAGADRVATGHTASDQAETVLLRVLRGSGLRGLAAMRPDSVWPVRTPGAPRLVRPLLIVSRDETAAYCRAAGLSPRHDPANTNLRYLRNRVRLELLPALRTLNPRVERVLNALADESAAWAELIDGAAAQQPPDFEFDGDGAVVRIDRLATLDPVRRTAAVRALLRTAFPDRPPPSRAHIEAVARLTVATADAAAHLPGGVQVRRLGDTLHLGATRLPEPALSTDMPVPIPGEVLLPGWRVRTRQTSGGERASDRWTAVIDAAAVRGLTVGPRRNGDRIALAGMTGRKRVQDLLVDAKVPRGERNRRPVFRAEAGVLWVAGLRTARWAVAGEGPAVAITVEPVS